MHQLFRISTVIINRLAHLANNQHGKMHRCNGFVWIKCHDYYAVIFSLHLHQVWDEADYVVPPAENGAFFVTTNVVITPNQTWGECPEVGDITIFFVRTYKLQKVQKYTNINYKTKFKSTKQTYIYTPTQQYHQ